ncbi:hypothetical protein D3C75_1191290 [compost metagenome]
MRHNHRYFRLDGGTSLNASIRTLAHSPVNLTVVFAPLFVLRIVPLSVRDFFALKCSVWQAPFTLLLIRPHETVLGDVILVSLEPRG